MVSAAKNDATLQKIILGVRDDELAAEIFAEKTQCDLDEARAAVKKVRRKMTKRCVVDIKKEIGEHLAALNELYCQATQMGDVKAALAIEKERGRSLSLYNKIEEAEKNKTDREKEEARRILQGAVETDFERLDDLARVVVNRLIELESRNK